MRKQAMQYLMDRMNEERVSMLPPWYKRLTETACITWAYKPVWTYHEATFLSLGYDPENFEISDDPEVVLDTRLAMGKEWKGIEDVLKRYMDVGELPYTTVPRFEDISDEVTHEIVYRPVTFTKWAMLNLPSFPRALHEAVMARCSEESAEPPTTVSAATTRIEPNATASPETSLRNSQRAKERCRAIAEMLWDQDGSIKINEMIVRPEIEKYGNGSVYAGKTIYNWIHDLAPKNRKS